MLLFQALTRRNKPIVSFASVLENSNLIHLFFTESHSGFLELQQLVERLHNNKK
jgi:hypothetical protein